MLVDFGLSRVPFLEIFKGSLERGRLLAQDVRF
jgi:hypothetical protein